MYDLVKNLNTLTLIKSSILHKLVTISENCICDYTLESVENDEDIVTIDIGIGIIYINILDSELSYKFVPSKKLEKKIIKTIETGDSPLIQDIEDKLNQRIFNTYKELL